MSLTSDHSIDRRRLKRRLSAWRALAVIALVGVAAVAIGRATGVTTGRHIARVTISGLITDELERNRNIVKLADDSLVKAVIVHVNSPGGTVVGGERLYQSLRKLGEKRPVVAVMGTTATSAGYMVALGADHVIANSGSVTGSIGVLLQTADVTKLLEMIGVDAEAIKSAPLKGVPSPLEKLTAEGRRATKEVVDDIYAMFVDMVAERRKLPRDQVTAFADGRVFTGRQALAHKLVDELGGEDEAKAWLKRERGIDDKLKVKDADVEPDSTSLSGIGRVMGAWVASGKMLLSERLTLDGLVSVWHPR